MSGSDGRSRSAYLEHTRDLADQLMRADDPYEIGWRLWSDSMDAVATDDYAVDMYVLWGALTDWVECRPHEEELARQHMVDAAGQWLALDLRDSDAVRRYLDHWLYDVMEISR